jgi:hypothetical protein
LLADTSYYHDEKQERHQEISVQRITSDASTILLMYFPPYLSSRILNLPLLLCMIFASIFSPSSIDRTHQQEYLSSFTIMLKSLSFTLKALLPYLPSVMASIIILIFVLILLTNHPNRSLTPYSEGLAALASGFSIISKDDYDNMAKQFCVCMMHFMHFVNQITRKKNC